MNEANTRMPRSLRLARGILIAVGLVFLLNGIVIIGLRLFSSIPSPPLPVKAAQMFLVLGAIGLVTAYVPLRRARPWAWVLLALIYIPWT